MRGSGNRNLTYSDEGGEAVALKWTSGTGKYHRVSGGGLVYAVAGEDGNPFLVYWEDAQVGKGATRRDVVRRGDQLVITERPGPKGALLPEIILEDGMEGSWEITGEGVYSTQPAGLLNARPGLPKVPPAVRRTVVLSDLPVVSAAVPAPPTQAQMLTGVALVPAARRGPLVTVEEAEDAEPDELKAAVDEIFRDYRVGRGPAGVVLLVDDKGVITIDGLSMRLSGLVARRRWDLLRALRSDVRTVELTERVVTQLPQRGYLVSSGSDKPWFWHDPDSDANDELFARRREAFVLDLRSAVDHAWPMAVNNSCESFFAVAGMVAGGDHVRPLERQDDLRLLVHCPRKAMRNLTVLLETGQPGVTASRGLALLSYRPQFAADGTVTFDTAMRSQYRPPYVVAFDSKGRPRVFDRF